MFQEQTNAFKINLSYGFGLRNKNTGRYKYYHSYCNCCGRYLDDPSLFTNSKDFDDFLERIRETDVLQWTINERPDSAWVCELVTNVTFFVYRIIDHPLGCVRATPFRSTSRRKKASSVWKRNPSITRGTMITMSLPMSGPASKMRSISIGSGGEEAVRPIHTKS